jgi:hypothetical protein
MEENVLEKIPLRKGILKIYDKKLRGLFSEWISFFSNDSPHHMH